MLCLACATSSPDGRLWPRRQRPPTAACVGAGAPSHAWSFPRLCHRAIDMHLGLPVIRPLPVMTSTRLSCGRIATAIVLHVTSSSHPSQKEVDMMWGSTSGPRVATSSIHSCPWLQRCVSGGYRYMLLHVSLRVDNMSPSCRLLRTSTLVLLSSTNAHNALSSHATPTLAAVQPSVECATMCAHCRQVASPLPSTTCPLHSDRASRCAVTTLT